MLAITEAKGKKNNHDSFIYLKISIKHLWCLSHVGGGGICANYLDVTETVLFNIVI